MEPPTRQAPPDEDTSVKGGQSPWVECIIEECELASGSCRRMESWVYRREHSQDFGKFLELRNFEPAGFLPSRFDGRDATVKATLNCRDRTVDASLKCAECVRLIKGGPYGARGVAVGAYPQQAEVLPCLQLSKSLPRYAPQPGEKMDGNQEDPRQTAFCNVVNVRL